MYKYDCDLNPGPSAPESSTLTTRLPNHPHSSTALLSVDVNNFVRDVVWQRQLCGGVRCTSTRGRRTASSAGAETTTASSARRRRAPPGVAPSTCRRAADSVPTASCALTCHVRPSTIRHDTTRYDTRCYIKVRSKPDMSQFSGAARGIGEASALWVDVQKLCNMCVLSLSWNFFVSHDK